MPVADLAACPPGGRLRRLARRAATPFLAAALVLAPAGAHAFGVPGCINLPEYNRALGALQGMTSACDMSVEEGRRIVAAHDGLPAVAPDAAVEEPRIAPGERPTRSKQRARDRRRALRVRG